MSEPSALISTSSWCERLIELLENVEACADSGEIHVKTDHGPASIWFREGRLVDAAMGATEGQTAILRLFNLDRATYDIEYKAVERRAAILDTLRELVEIRARRAEEWQRMLELAPPLDTILGLEHAVLDRERASLAEPEFSLLYYFDGRRTVLDVIDDSGLDAIAVLERIVAYLKLGLLVLAARAPSAFPVDRGT